MLHQLTLGRGPDLVMLHGWGMHGGVMRDLAEGLAARFRVTLIDLPGHGRSPVTADLSLQGMVAAVLAGAPADAQWLGWSLGALLCLKAANTPAARARGVILMAGTPRFVSDTGWPGLDEALLAQFARDLAQDCVKCMQRFLGLQLAGSENARRLMKDLRARLDVSKPAAPTALQAGLAILRSVDLRAELAALRVPVSAVLGGRDRLVPSGLGEALQALHPGVRVEILDAATHLPFLSHRDLTRQAVERLLRHDEA